MDWDPVWELGKIVVPIISALVGVGVAVWKAGAKDKPDFIMGGYYRERMADKDAQLAKADARADRAEARADRAEERIDRLLITTDRSVKAAARRLPTSSAAAPGGS